MYNGSHWWVFALTVRASENRASRLPWMLCRAQPNLSERKGQKRLYMFFTRLVVRRADCVVVRNCREWSRMVRKIIPGKFLYITGHSWLKHKRMGSVRRTVLWPGGKGLKGYWVKGLKGYWVKGLRLRQASVPVWIWCKVTTFSCSAQIIRQLFSADFQSSAQ